MTQTAKPPTQSKSKSFCLLLIYNFGRPKSPMPFHPFQHIADQIRERRERRRDGHGPKPVPVPPPAPVPFPVPPSPVEPNSKPQPVPRPVPATLPSLSLLQLLWAAFRYRKVLTMTLSKFSVVSGAVVLLCGAVYNAFGLHDYHQASVLFAGALAAFGIGNQTAITRDIVDPTRPDPTVK